MNAILLRVGIDSGKYAGQWNAPCNPENGDFVYVPVPAGDWLEKLPVERNYTQLLAPALERFSSKNDWPIPLPGRLQDKSTHLDPDFRSSRLSYGNSYNHKGKLLKEFCQGDGERFVIFYSSMEPIRKTRPLEYGIIGILKVQAVKHVKQITIEAELSRNIHARLRPRRDTDVVIFGEPEKSGRLDKYLPIGELRENGIYYLSEALKTEWGGVCGKSGENIKGGIQRSIPMRLRNAPRFFEWFNRQNRSLIQKNNP